MDDVYCPICRLVVQRRGSGQITPRHCPRCLARSRRLVPMLALDQLPERAEEPPAPNRRRPGSTRS